MQDASSDGASDSASQSAQERSVEKVKGFLGELSLGQIGSHLDSWSHDQEAMPLTLDASTITT